MKLLVCFALCVWPCAADVITGLGGTVSLGDINGTITEQFSFSADTEVHGYFQFSYTENPPRCVVPPVGGCGGTAIQQASIEGGQFGNGTQALNAQETLTLFPQPSSFDFTVSGCCSILFAVLERGIYTIDLTLAEFYYPLGGSAPGIPQLNTLTGQFIADTGTISAILPPANVPVSLFAFRGSSIPVSLNPEPATLAMLGAAGLLGGWKLRNKHRRNRRG